MPKREEIKEKAQKLKELENYEDKSKELQKYIEDPDYKIASIKVRFVGQKEGRPYQYITFNRTDFEKTFKELRRNLLAGLSNIISSLEFDLRL